MKHRDRLFLILPGLLLLLTLLAGLLLFSQYRTFEQDTLAEARDNLSRQTRFIAETLLPELRQGNLAAVQARIAFFQGQPLRVTLIRADGIVLADSEADPTKLANHSERPEVLDAAADQEGAFATRYSTTLHTYLLYHTLRREGWIFRTALPQATITHSVAGLRHALTLSLLLGAGLALLLLAYFLKRLRPQFNTLQTAAVAIARGHLETPITPPQGGPLRELAQAIAIMGRQLRLQIDRLRHERNEFDALFNTMQEPLLLVAANGEIICANRAAGKLFGADIRQPGFRIERTTSPELVAYVRAAFQEPILNARELPFDDGSTPRTLLAHAVRMERDGALTLLLVLTDLTDLRRLESFRSDFIANVSHEIKTPLTAILSTVETLRDTPLDDAAKNRCLEILTRQSRRLNDLVRDILSLAAIERRQSVPDPSFSPLALGPLLQSAVALCQDEADRLAIPLVLTLPDAPLTTIGDAHLLEQALVNLITNALRHATGTPNIQIALTPHGRTAQITITDHGCGISAEHLPRLFERFYRVHKDRSRERGGTGLGLAIVKHTALLHHGTITVTSTPGCGTTFTLTLPLA